MVASGGGGVEQQVLNSERIRLDRNHSPGVATDGETEHPAAGVGVENGVILVRGERLTHQAHQHLGARGVVLKERIPGDTKRDPETVSTMVPDPTTGRSSPRLR